MLVDDLIESNKKLLHNVGWDRVSHFTNDKGWEMDFWSYGDEVMTVVTEKFNLPLTGKSAISVKVIEFKSKEEVNEWFKGVQKVQTWRKAEEVN